MHYFYTLAALTAGVSTVSAAPLSADVISAVKSHFNLPLARRDDPIQTQSPIDGIPGCSGEGEDPTYAQGPSAHKDGEGVFIGTDCTTGHHSQHCWTDYYLVGTTDGYGDWYKAMGNIDCPDGGGNCQQMIGKTDQQCKSFTWGISEEVNAGFEWEIGFKLGASFTSTQSWTKQTCNGDTNTNSCTWTDTGCHSIWASQLITTVQGYKRRSCVSPTDDSTANMPNSPKRDDGFYTRGMMDFTVPITGMTQYNCDGTCASDYAGPGDVPTSPNGGAFTPWTGTVPKNG
ncbi:MAG: hypothetical protein MMC23_008011 [Stictis urceolatum]|nr:hypothetical protein [Stictis urceolata]